MEGQCATKRPRPIQRPAGGAGKRKLAQDTASPPEKKRSRRQDANSEAARLLDSDTAIDDSKMPQVPRLWKLSENATRVHVMSRDAAFVLSDTLGLAATRTGILTVSRLTRRDLAVPELFSSWGRQVWPRARPFPFTSINDNYSYAARMHRDLNNTGPSLTECFGEFRGGAPKHWDEDDGSPSLEELGRFLATVVETGSALCLFDGRRDDSVEPFDGERCSLVFLCTSAFASAREDVMAFVSSLCTHTHACFSPASNSLPSSGEGLRPRQAAAKHTT